MLGRNVIHPEVNANAMEQSEEPVTDSATKVTPEPSTGSANKLTRDDHTRRPNDIVPDNKNNNNNDSMPLQEFQEATVIPLTTYANPTPKILLSDDDEALFFNDGLRRIDFILAYKPRLDKDQTDGESPQFENDEDAEKRTIFLTNCQKEGLETEETDMAESQDQSTVFIKVHGTWSMLTRHAELMKVKMPIGINDLAEKKKHGCCYCAAFDVDRQLIQKEQEYFVWEYTLEHADKFLNADNHALFFSPSQRSRIVWNALCKIKYDEVCSYNGGTYRAEKTTDLARPGSARKQKFGIKQLMDGQIFCAAYPLHDGDYKKKDTNIRDADKPNKRWILYDTWAKFYNFYKMQPLQLVCRYFGEKIGMYFAWLGFYTQALISPAIMGFVFFIVSIIQFATDTAAWSDICDESKAGNFTMCPQCDKQCPFWKLKNSCLMAKVSFIFDNGSTVSFAVCMSLWSTIYLEFWKRKQKTLAWKWHVDDVELLEPIRPEFEASVFKTKKNPITEMLEPYLPSWQRKIRLTGTFSIILFMLCLLLMVVVGVTIYRIIISNLLYMNSDSDLIQTNARLITTATAALINLICIVVLSWVYTWLANVLTNMELHRTQTEHEDSYTIKMFCFMFVNYYSSLFYIAFFKGGFYSFASDKNHVMGYRQEECDPAGCLVELSIQLIIIMIGKQAINNFLELVLPAALLWWRRRSSTADETNVYTRWEQDFDLQDYPPKGLFDEYLEMVLQFGFLSLFVTAFPLAPLFALLNNILELRLDGYKRVVQLRRPVAEQAADIGIWMDILSCLSIIGVIINGFIIAYTSDYIPRLVYQYDQGTLEGYIQNTLSVFQLTDKTTPDDPKPEIYGKNVTQCYYRGYYGPPGNSNAYEPTTVYWYVLAARLLFVIVFEHTIFFVKGVIAFVIPDVPQNVKIQMQKEQFWAKKMLFEKTDMLGDFKSNMSLAVKDSKQSTPGSRDKSDDGSSTSQNKPSPSGSQTAVGDNNSRELQIDAEKLLSIDDSPEA